MDAATQQNLHLLTDVQTQLRTVSRGIQLPEGELDTALQYLLQEEYIRQEDGMLALSC